MILIMYSIYINNQCAIAAYVRLSSEKMPYSDSYVQKLKEEILDGTKGKEWAKECTSFLAIGGFCLISPKATLPFPAENAATSLYVSVVYYEATFGLTTAGLLNFPFDPKMYGCISIDLSPSVTVVLLPHNPKAVWVPAKSGDKLPIDSAVAGSVGRNFDLYFGRMEYGDGIVMPCAVTSSGKCGKWVVGGYEGQEGHLLRDTGFELIRANRGDAIPPNAVMTGVIPTIGSLFVGRVGGKFPCYITTEDGKVQCFVYGVQNQKYSVENGEIMVLTRSII